MTWELIVLYMSGRLLIAFVLVVDCDPWKNRPHQEKYYGKMEQSLEIKIITVGSSVNKAEPTLER